MAISDQLQTLKNTKNSIKQAIIAKGVSVTSGDTFASYATKISQIEQDPYLGKYVILGTYNQTVAALAPDSASSYVKDLSSYITPSQLDTLTWDDIKDIPYINNCIIYVKKYSGGSGYSIFNYNTYKYLHMTPNSPTISFDSGEGVQLDIKNNGTKYTFSIFCPTDRSRWLSYYKTSQTSKWGSYSYANSDTYMIKVTE